MTDNPAGAVETMREKLKAGAYDISDADRDALLDVSDRIRLLGPSKYSHHRHEFILRRALILAKEVGGIADALEDREATEQLVGHINAEKSGSAETNKDYRVALRAFGKLATEGDDYPDSIRWVPGGYPSNYDPAPTPSDMLRWNEDVQPMLSAALNARDKALVAVAWDLGPRPSELFSLTRDAISNHEYGFQITVEGKKGTRSPVLVPSVSYLQDWLNVHPGDPEGPLWSKLTKPGQISNNRVRDIFKEIADRAGVSKPVTPTNFRKSSASYLASQGVSQAHLENHHGWSRGSKIAARYIAVFDDANDQEIAAAHGIEIDTEEGTGLTVIPCPRCGQQVPQSEGLCPRCGQALNPKAAAEADDEQSDLAKTLASLTPEQARKLIEAAEVIDDPSVMSAILD